MAWFSKSKNTVETRGLRDLSNEEREQLELAIMDGVPSSELSREFGISSSTIYQLKRNQNMSGGNSQSFRRQNYNSDEQAAKDEIKTLKAQAELERVREELELSREERKLNIELKKLELRERQEELLGDDYDIEPEDFAENPEKAAWSFFVELLKKGQRNGNAPTEYIPQNTPPPSINWTVDLTKEQIKAEMLKQSREDILRVKAAPDEMIRSGLRQKYLGITENNINLILEEIRHYE